MIDYKTGYSNEEILQVKKSLHFKNTSYIWNTYHFNQSKKVGKCSKAAQEYYFKCKDENIEPTIEGYEEYYFEHAIDYKDFVENARNFKNKLKESGIKITYELAYFYQWIRVIYDSYHGTIEKEFKLIDQIGQNSYVEHADEETDRKYAIDLLVLNSYGYYEGIQMKPISFLNGILANKEDIIKDCGYCLNGQQEWLKIDGNTKVTWYFYKDNELIKKTFDEVKEIYDNSNRQS